MRFYRVEDENGQGPYRRTSPLRNQICKDHNTGDRWPDPWEDGIDFDVMGHVCGFPSMDALRDWFEGWGDRLVQAGFHLNVYEVSEQLVEAGQRQAAAYTHDLGNRVDRLDLTGI